MVKGKETWFLEPSPDVLKIVVKHMNMTIASLDIPESNVLLFVIIISSYFDIDFFEIGTEKLLAIIVDVIVYQVARIREKVNGTKVGSYYWHISS